MSGVLRFTFSKPGSSTPFSKKIRNSCYMYIFRGGNLYWVFWCIFHHPGSSNQADPVWTGAKSNNKMASGVGGGKETRPRIADSTSCSVLNL